MKRFACLFIWLLASIPVLAQYGNEWIRFNQQYFKIPVGKDGIYRLTYADLQAAGFPMSSDYRRIQLFHRGAEQTIRIEKANAGVLPLEPGDYIEFYGIKNTGLTDAELYQPANTQPHQYYNLYSDTTSYFLTFNPLPELGKRMEVISETNSGGIIPKENYHKDEKLIVLTSEYSTGILYNDYIQNSFFETGEGWTGKQIGKDQFVDYTFTGLTNTYPSGELPILEIMCVGRASLPHQVEISVGPASPSRVIGTFFFSEYSTTTISANLNWSDIGSDGKLVVRVKALGVAGANDLLSASYIRVKVPQVFNASGGEKVFQLNENTDDKSYIEIQNAPNGSLLYDITNPSEVRLISTTNTTTRNAVITSTSISRKLLLTNGALTPSIKPVTFRSINPALHNYVIVSHSSLMKPSSQYSDPVTAYGSYRKSQAGGGYDTLIVTVQQLYDQFTSGEQTPAAIKRFMKFMVENGSPEYLFFIGKGLDVNLNYHRDPVSNAPYKDLVPSYGMPASDVLFTAGLAGTSIEPAVPTGRITASTPADVEAYLNKVKEMEALPFNTLWRKELLHLSGGIFPGEPELFRSYLQGFEFVANDFYLGGRTSSISKNNTQIEFINISDKINAGVNLVTLFGHSAPNQNDFNIGYVSASELGYNNQGKYPMFLINGCNAGDFFYKTTRYGEDWVNTPNKGAIAFMANTSFGFSNVLRLFSHTFYSIAYGDSVFIKRGVGDVLKEIGRRFSAQGFGSVAYVTQTQQMMLLGDPAVKIFGALKPDYEINDTSIFEESFSTEPITALSDSFAIKIVARNFGIAKEDSISIKVKREFSDKSYVEYDSLFPPVLYRDTITFVIRNNEKGFGNNDFTITIDALNSVGEIDEENNVAKRTVYIPLNSSRNLFPQNFSIVSSTDQNLLVQSTDVLGASRSFTVQLDTVDTFDSPFFQTFTIDGTIASQAVTLLNFDTLAYYWRSKFTNPLNGESTDWSTSSFTYINNGPEGWAQVHFPQMLSNGAAGLVFDLQQQQLSLKETVTDLSITTFGIDYSGYVTRTYDGYTKTYHPDLSVMIGGANYHPSSIVNEGPNVGCRKNTINLVAFNKTTTTPYIGIPFLQYPDVRACGRRPEIIASFTSTEVEAADGKNLIQYIENIPAGDSVVLFSLGDPGFTSWSTNVFTKLTELGIAATQVTSLQPGEPFIIYAKKGTSPGNALVVKSSTVPLANQSLTNNSTITGRYTSGSLESVLIGPAQNWQQIILKNEITELPQTDEYSFDIVGIKLQGGVDTLLTNVTTNVDISFVDAEVYPYLRLIYKAMDEVNLTPPQLDKWLVIYTPAAEGVLISNNSTSLQTLQEGEVWSGSYSFANISTKSFSDSLVVRYELLNKVARGALINSKKIKAPTPGTKTDFILDVPTIGKSGLNDFDVYVNPRIQPELYYDNNILQLNNYIQVIPDLFNPALDVTIDGRYVTNGDFVSANPDIQIKIWDENPFLLKDDTTGIEIYLQYPCDNGDCIFKSIYFSRNDVTWAPASESEDFTVHFMPVNLVEGEYVLRVNARDVVGNRSGEKPYEVRFLVRSFSTLEIRKPYPNPTAQFINFSALITGSELPDAVSIQVISPEGRVVHDLYSNSFFVGTNHWVWNGTDATGNRVPPGLYIYKMNLMQNNRVIKSVNGKLMLVR